MSEPITDAAAETKDLLRSFFAMAKEQTSAAQEGKAALRRLTAATVRRDTGQALVVRSFLLSLYNGENPRVDLSEIMRLDWPLRKDLSTVIGTAGGPDFADFLIREAYVEAGDDGAKWFLEEATD